MTVRASSDYILQYSSRIPVETELLGGTVGVPADGFCTWSINPLPEDFVKNVHVGDKNVVGWWSNDGAVIDKRLIGVGAVEQMKMLTDLPVIIRSDKLANFFQCNKLWDLFRSYRLTYVNLTFTVPENVNVKPNHNLYIEWCDGRKWRPSAFEDCRGMVCSDAPNYASAQGWEIRGWNWLPNPPDIAESCCPLGRISPGQGWHRRQLSYNHPVTIRFRPRHCDLQASHQNYADSTSTGNNGADKVQFNWTNSGHFVRSYLDTDIANSLIAETQYWFGPVIRLVDADSSAGANVTDVNLFTLFAVRVHCSMGMRLKFMKGNDDPFPNFVP